jgi:ABC-2 type transport system permease protein
MKQLQSALWAEWQKNKHTSIRWISVLAFSLAPLMGGLLMHLLRHPAAPGQASPLQVKAQMLSFSADWPSYLSLLSQSVGVGGVLLFGFVASWLFGREYAEGTAKDLLALPTSRTTILQAKFIGYGLWCMGLAAFNFLFGLLIGTLLGLPGWTSAALQQHATHYAITTLLTVALGTPIAWLALIGKGYLAPLGWVALTLVLAQIIAAIGLGAYFPWAVPGLYSGAGRATEPFLPTTSYLLLALTSGAGYLATLFYWNYADQTQ